MKQYPHFLFRKAVGSSERDADGNWTKSTSDEWIFHSMCREETNGKGSVIELADGRTVVFSSLIQCPKGTAAIPVETEVMVCNANDVMDEGQRRIQSRCLKSSVDQLHTRVWL